MNALDPKRIDQARNTTLPSDNLRIAIDDLGPIGDDPEMHLVQIKGRFFRVRGSLLTAVQNYTIDELNPRELAELHRFNRSMVSPARTDAGVSHLKLRTEFPLTLLLRGFAQMTSLLARYPLITGASVVVVSALVLTRCAMSDRIPHLDGIVVLGAFAIRLMSTLLHEIGHLSVARHFGAPANRMGIGLWWGLFPAFYADVTSAWLLNRKQRIAVTLAGPFFTLVSMIPIGIGSLALHGPVGDACFVALVMSGTSFVFNLLPFGRLDGYWVLVDLTGERFLLRNSSDAIRSFFRGEPLSRFSNVVLLHALGRLLLTVCVLTVIALALHSLVKQTQSFESFSSGVAQSLWGFLPISFAIFVLWSATTIFKSISSESP